MNYKQKDVDWGDLVLTILAPIIIFIPLYAAINFVPFVWGVLEARDADESCKSKRSRIEYVFVGYRVGCWAGERVE